MAIVNSVSDNSIVSADSIKVFDCHLSGVVIHLPRNSMNSV